MLDREPKNPECSNSPHAELLLGELLSSESPLEVQHRKPAAIRTGMLDARQHLSLLWKAPCNALTHRAEWKLHCFSNYWFPSQLLRVIWKWMPIFIDMQLLILYTHLSPSSGSQMYNERKSRMHQLQMFFKSKHSEYLAAAQKGGSKH